MEDRKLDEVTHLASVRRQKVGNGTLGIHIRITKDGLNRLFFIEIMQNT